MERFWEALARRYPGRVTIAWKHLSKIPTRLAATDAQFVEFDFNRPDAVDFVRANGFQHLYLTDKPYVSRSNWQMRLAGVRSIIIHDHTPGERSRASGARRMVKSALARFRPCAADAYIAVSELVLRRFAECVCLPASKCHLARNGIDLELAAAPVDIRAELGLPADALVVVSSSRANKYKRIHHIIEAAAKVDGVYFIHCGSGPDMPYFAAEIERLGLSRRFFLLGARSDVAGILESADIAVHASAGEVGTSLSILEFMRAGLPMVVPNSPSVSQGLRDGFSALLYVPGNVDALAASLRLLAVNQQMREMIGAAARSEVAAYDINGTVGAVLKVFERLRV